MASGLIRNGAEILTSPAGGPTLRWRFLISLNTTSAAISPNSSFKTVGIGRGIALLQKLIDIRDTGEGDLTSRERPSVRRRHANEDAVTTKAVINLVHSTGQFFGFTSRRRIDVRCTREQIRL